MRFQGKSRLGFYPLPMSEAQRIRRFLMFPDLSSAIDPCVGDGVTFEAITSGAQVLRYGTQAVSEQKREAASKVVRVLLKV